MRRPANQLGRLFSLEGAKVSIELFFKAHMLPIGMAVGALAYVLYHAVTPIHFLGPFLLSAVKLLQPFLLFVMLFLTFCKVEPSQLRPHRWQWWLIAVQALSFVALALILLLVGGNPSTTAGGSPGAISEVGVPLEFWSIIIEGAMLCMICPTATAAAVVTGKLGGDVAGIITYTILINIVVALLVPAIVPLVHPMPGMSFIVAFRTILSQVFPLLICPCLLAWLVRYLAPSAHRAILRHPDLAFYVWAVALPMAILMTVRAIYHSDASLLILGGLALVALLTCAFQFWIGKLLGAKYDRIKAAERQGAAADPGGTPTGQSAPSTSGRVVAHASSQGIGRITAGQSIGQKNTVFAIWMGYTFMSPIASIVGGFYSICHNIFNSWQLGRVGKRH